MIGQSLRRREDLPLIRGDGRYIGDLSFPGMLHAAFARSIVAHGIVRSIEIGDALAVPGVEAVYTAADLDCPLIPGRLIGGPEGAGMERPPLVRERVRYLGEAVAVVLATSAAAAAEGAHMIYADVDELESVVDSRAAMSSDVLLFPGVGSNILDRDVLDAYRPEDEGEIRITVEAEHERVAPVSIEPLGIVVVPRRDAFEVWCSHQNPHGLKRQLQSLFATEGVEVHVPDVGGAFGLKGALYPEYVVAFAAARVLDRPVSWVQLRREHFLGGHHGRGQINRLELTGDRDGRIRSLRATTIADVGAYPHSGGFVPLITRLMASGPYDVQNVLVETISVVTNRAPVGPYRGAGRPEATFILERAVDEYARGIGIDPVEVRTRNLIRPDQMPYQTATGALYDGGDYRRALERALELAEAPAVLAEQQTRLAGGKDPLGLGVCLFVEQAGGSAVTIGEYARVEVSPSGAVTLFTGSTPAGQGHATTWSQVVAPHLGMDPGAVAVVAGDTSRVPLGFGSFASRSTQLGASAAANAARAVAERARRFLAEQLEAHIDDVVIADGRVMVTGAPATAVALGEVAAELSRRGEPLVEEDHFVSGAQTFPYGACVVVVEVALETGEVRIRRIAMVDDCGNRINPMLVEGQVVGGMVQGLGQALYERVIYDGRGQLLNPSLVHYDIPHASDVPPMVFDGIVTPAPSNPLGAKGVGEAGAIGLPPAIVNAVLDALRPYGVIDITMPLTPERVWTAIEAARRS
jgi:carbon-monoxide dehydrogenase large subunit